jgi:predicted transcriptional regulator
LGKAEQSNLKVELLLTKIIDELDLVNQKLDSLIELDEKILKTQEKFQRVGNDKGHFETELKPELDPMSLLSLPTSLRKTVVALYKLEKATAKDLAKETQRLRAVESAAANQLVRMGYLKKKREGREVYFYIESPMEIRK